MSQPAGFGVSSQMCVIGTFMPRQMLYFKFNVCLSKVIISTRDRVNRSPFNFQNPVFIILLASHLFIREDLTIMLIGSSDSPSVITVPLSGALYRSTLLPWVSPVRVHTG